MTSDPYSDSPGDPYGAARSMQTAVDRLVDAMSEKLKAHVLGLPGEEPARIEVTVSEPDGIDARVEIALPLGVTRDAIGHLTAVATSVLQAVPLRVPTEVTIVDDGTGHPADHPV